MKKSKVILYSLILLPFFILLYIFFPPFLSSTIKMDIDNLFNNPITYWYLIFEFVGLMALLGFVIYFGIHFLASFGSVFKSKKQFFPNITILIASKNERLLLERTLNSIVKSDYPKDKMQIIIVTSNSTDNSTEFCEKFAMEHNLIDILILSKNIPKKGKPAALNYGLKSVEHDICIFYDSGNILISNTLQNLVAPLQNKDINVTIGFLVVKNWKQNKWTRATAFDYSFISGGGILSEVKNKLGSSCYLFGRNFCIRKDVLFHYNGFNENSITEDLYLNVLLNLDEEKILFVPDAKAYEIVPNTWNTIKKQRTRWVLGSKRDMPKLSTLKKGKKTATSIIFSRGLSLILLANIDIWILVMIGFTFLYILISEFLLLSWTLLCLIFSLGFIFNGIRKYGDKRYITFFYLIFSVYIHFFMLTRNISSSSSSADEIEWERTRIEL